MTFGTRSRHRLGSASLIVLSAVAIWAAGAANSAYAQDGGGQQLPDSVINQQIPPTFPGDGAVDSSGGGALSSSQSGGLVSGDSGAASGASVSSAGSANNQSADQARAAQGVETEVEQNGAGQQGGQSAASQGGGASDAIPAEPTQRRLVPSTPMGAAAQSADNGQGGTASPNPVEDAAAAADQSMDVQNEDAAPPPSIMDQYAAGDGSGGQGGDALPQVNNLNMVKLSGQGFGNAASQNVTVPIDPTMGEGKTPAEMQEEIRAEAFDAAITGMFPLKPDQIETLLKKYDETQRAVESPTFNNPKPEVSVQNVSLDPGVAPPVIRTAVGNVTTLNILDITGAPWPVQDVTWAGDYEIVEPEEGGHIIRITPMSHFARGNIVIRMLTLKTPLTMTLETGRDVVQYRVDARIPEYGPFATPSLMQGGKTLVAGDPELTAILDGAPPSGMAKMQVSGTDGRTTAYSSGAMTYVRTPLTLLSPAWQSSISSADGMNVYALGTAPVLLLSDSGEFVRATLTEKKDLLDE